MRASDGDEQNAGWYRETSPLLPTKGGGQQGLFVFAEAELSWAA